MMRTVIVIVHAHGQAENALDQFGPELAAHVERVGCDVVAIELVPIEGDLFEERLTHYVDDQVSLVLTSGGAGIGSHDVVPELTSILIDRRVPGLEELMRRALIAQAPRGAFERGSVGLAGATLIVNLPAEIEGARIALDALAPVLPDLWQQLADARP